MSENSKIVSIDVSGKKQLAPQYSLNQRRFSIVALFGLLAIVLSGCGSGSSSGGITTPTPISTPVSTPTPIPTSTGNSSYTLLPGTLMLEPGKAILVKQDATSLTVQGSLPAFKPGSIVVSTLGNGALRKVVSVSTTGNATTLKTEQASFAEAFKKFNFKYDKDIGPSDVPVLPNLKPGMKLSWENASTTALNQRGLTAIDGPALKLAFENYALSAGIEIDGDAHFQLKPNLAVDLVDVPGETLPTVTMEASLSPSYSHLLAMKSKFGGTVSGKIDESIPLTTLRFPGPFGIPILVNVVIKVESSLSGTASGAFTTTTTASANGVVALTRGLDRQFKYTQNFSPKFEGKFQSIEASMKGTVVPLKVGIQFRFYDVAGPGFSISCQDDLIGTYEKNGVTGEEGTRAKLTDRGVGSIHLEGDTERWKKLLGGRTAEVSLFNFEFDIVKPTVKFDDFFPYPGKASIVVMDNGNSPDDIFEVAVGNVVLGRTTKGGSGQFRIGALRPGNAQLRLTTIEDDDPPGTWGITLGEGVTFADGTTAKSGTLSLGSSMVFDVVIPQPNTASRAVAGQAMPAMPRNTVIER